jgi:hypothetical protein
MNDTIAIHKTIESRQTTRKVIKETKWKLIERGQLPQQGKRLSLISSSVRVTIMVPKQTIIRVHETIDERRVACESQQVKEISHMESKKNTMGP